MINTALAIIVVLVGIGTFFGIVLALADKKFAMEVNLCLQRYAVKDWGNLDAEDKQANEDALQYPDDLYLLAAYKTCKGKIWIITNRISENAGDNATTVCFPDER